MSNRPTTDPKTVVLDLLDTGWSSLDARLAGLTDDEYRWEPAATVWTVRPVGGIGGVADAAGEHMEADTGPGTTPITTIAWRMWHLAVDCFDMFSGRILGTTGASVSGGDWFVDAERAHAELSAAFANFRNGVAGRSSDAWWDELGPDWGPFAHHSLLDLVQHTSHELIHHGAEIALLRDLYAAR